MLCPRCHTENREGRRFCAKCAAPLAVVCTSCGFTNDPGDEFCGGCAQSLRAGTPMPPKLQSPESYTPKHLAEKILTSKAALEGERKQVTVLFADLKGSMELLADRDPEEARKLLDPVLEYMMEAVHQYEGTVNQVMGDGIMSLFGAPLAHEDHAVRACYAALRIQESVKRYAEGVFRSFGVPVQIRVGLNSGDVVVRAIGSDLHMDYTAVGQTTHLAARMEQMAQPGAILLTPETLALAEGFVQVLSRGPVPVKGLTTLVNYRPEYRHGWASKTYYQQVRLDALPATSAQELLDALLGTDPGLAHLQRLMIERTQGNPFFLEESVRALVEMRALTGERGAHRLVGPIQSLQLPATAQAILAARIDRLAPGDKRLLQAAAVVGKDVPFGLLQAIAEEPEENVGNRSCGCKRRSSSTKRGSSRTSNTRSSTR